MFAAIISRVLFYYAFHAGAIDPEDVAQDVIVHLLKHPPRVKSNMAGYLRMAVRNERCRKWRRKDGKVPPLSIEAEIVGMPDPHYEGVEHTDFDDLLAAYPDMVNWLIEYSEAPRHPRHGMMDRVRAHRRRRKLREVLAT